ncbi:hypothetical protein BSPWISOXPB_4409 [uncultured Gammaproteobacteria bacterium]|nr:hypothetical protein BSPWISOXPB_4409 [uncultured Gammaproteobacteria bacterium]
MRNKHNILLLTILINWSTFAVTVDENDNKAVAVFYNTDQNMNDGNVNQINLKAAQAAFKISKPKDSIKTCDYAEKRNLQNNH